MAWPEVRPGGRRYVVWRQRVRGPDGVTRSVRRSRPVGAIGQQEAAQEAETTTRVVERREPRPRHVGPSRALRAFLKEWRDVRRRAPETVRFYSKLLDPCFAFMAALGPLRAWNARWVSQYVATRSDYAPRSVQMLLTACRTFAKWARRAGISCPDFARDVEGPRVTRPERQAYTAHELRELLGAAEGKWIEVPVALAGLAGLSLGDLRALRGSAIDMKAKRISAPRSKTGRPMTLPIVPTLARILRRHGPFGPDELVCELSTSDSNVYRAWRSLCKDAAVTPKGGFKRLRHTYQTLLDAGHVDSATRRDLMAHAPGSRMTDLYCHADWERMVRGASAIERAITPKGVRAGKIPVEA